VASIICTLGIGGFFWIGVAMLLGAALQVLLPSLRARPGQPQAAKAADNPPAPLIAYASGRLGIGIREGRVRRDLHRAGWGDALIESVLARAHAQLAARAADGIRSGPDAR
jgi:hypothetical protein